jgi:DNA topoisomerase-1
MIWDAPVKNDKCPECGGILVKKKGKKSTICCINPECGYKK